MAKSKKNMKPNTTPTSRVQIKKTSKTDVGASAKYPPPGVALANEAPVVSESAYIPPTRKMRRGKKG
jgi:hypothetical protein